VISLFKNFKKKSPQAKAGIIAFIVFMVLLVSYVLYSNLKPEPPAEYEITEVSYGTITDYLDVSGTVESGVTEDLVAIEGVFVEEVFVNVGDTVKKGDKLATFNVSGAAVYLAEAKNAYDKAMKEYNETKNSASANANRKTEIAAEVEELSGKITAKQSEIEALKNELEVSGATETAPIPDEQINQIAMQMLANGSSLKQIKQFKEAASNVQLPVVDSASSAKQQELLQKNLELAQLNSELSALYAEDAATIIADESVVKALKSVADNKKLEYDRIKMAYDKMASGWVADNNGIVTQVNLKAGEKFIPVKEASSSTFDISSLLGTSVDIETANLVSSLMGNSSAPMGTGIKLESYEDIIVSITVGKSDLLKIKVGMEAVITSLGTEYKGEVVYVSATASESSGGLDLGSIAGSLMGTGGGASGAEVKVKINNPDEKIVIGFDVDIKVILDTFEDVLKVPVESVIYNNGIYSVFVYDEEEKTVSKRTVTKGSLDETSYEIVDGLVEGEKVVKSPDPNMEDGTKIAMKNA
jgi:multidrug efflux pump subunit AcrA (membrane-fusion protein)